jgi:hypothetical protein
VSGFPISLNVGIFGLQFWPLSAHPSQHQQTKPQNMTTKSKKQSRTTSRKKKLTLNKETVRDLSAHDRAERVGGGVVRTADCGGYSADPIKCNLRFGTLA